MFGLDANFQFGIIIVENQCFSGFKWNLAFADIVQVSYIDIWYFRKSKKYNFCASGGGDVGINKYDKHYYEKYALLSLCYILGLNTNDFEQKDKPDLQSEKYGVGIEVVRAITDQDGLTQSLVQRYFGKGIPGEEVVKEVIANNKKGKFKGYVTSIDGVAVISSANGFHDGALHKNLIVEKIKEKSHLFKAYKHFENNGLYCFAETSILNETDYPDIIKACQESPFSIVMINCIDSILCWNVSANAFKRYEIPSEFLREWSQKAL